MNSNGIITTNELVPKIHFIRVVEIKNAGDMMCGPDSYFKQFSATHPCLCHDIRNIDFAVINAYDWVILGGGGIFECREDYQNIINRLLNTCKNVIAWGCGHNNHYDRIMNRNIDFERFRFLTVRDWNYQGHRYCPCVSCMMKGLAKKYRIVRKIGVIEHLAFPITEFSFEKISNRYSAENVLSFIGTSEIIITNSYHCVYWATLMSKKVILYKSFSTKFEYFKYPPVIYSGNLDEDMGKAVNYLTAIGESRNLNIEFKNEVIDTIKWLDKIYTSIRYICLELLKGGKVAIKGAGIHTRELLKLLQNSLQFKCIVAKEKTAELPCDCDIIPDEELEKYDVDTIILSSYKYRDEMKKEIEKLPGKYVSIDIYERLEGMGVKLDKEFYYY